MRITFVTLGLVGHGTTKKLAFEAYPQWAAAHPASECPPTIDALLEFVDMKDMLDPWGTPYKMMCGPTLPAGVRGFAIESWGPDKKDNTQDDLRSWDP